MSLKVPAIEPWHSVIERTAKDLDAINIMAYDYYWPVIIIVIIVISISTIKVIIKIFKDIPLAGLHRFFHLRYSEIKVTQKYVLIVDISLLQGYTFDLDLNTLKSLGVPADKIVYGIMPGHSDARKYTNPTTFASTPMLRNFSIDNLFTIDNHASRFSPLIIMHHVFHHW